MAETFVPLDLPPGVRNNGTRYQSKGRWYLSHLVRFNQGRIMPVGGWTQRALTGAPIVGTPNAAISWQTNDGLSVIAVGTTDALYTIIDGVVDNLSVASDEPNVGSWQWDLSLFGDYLIAAIRRDDPHDISVTWDGTAWQVDPFLDQGTAVYVWYADPADGQCYAVDGPNDMPSFAYGAFVTPERHLVLLRGSLPIDLTLPMATNPNSVRDHSVRRVYWNTQEQLNDWVFDDPTNTAGYFDLATQGALVCGKAARGQSLLWTTTDLWTMTYLGGDLVYSFGRAGDNCGIKGANAAVLVDSSAYWMGEEKFFVYDGFVRAIPCEVEDYVFGDMNQSAKDTIWALANPRFNEVTWFYPSAFATSPDKYVTYNYVENHWAFGNLARCAGISQQALASDPVPLMFKSDGTLWQHETGNARTGENDAYIESGPLEVGNGERVAQIQGIIPDDRTVGDVEAWITTSMYPDDSGTLNGPYTLTEKTDLRLTARQFRVQLREATASAWRVGVIRLAAILGGRR
jgi:hypothetical protein